MIIEYKDNDIEFIRQSYISPTSILTIIKYLKENDKVVYGDFLWPIKLGARLKFDHCVSKTKFIVGAIGDRDLKSKTPTFTPFSVRNHFVQHPGRFIYSLPISNSKSFYQEEEIYKLGFKILFAFPIPNSQTKEISFALQPFISH